MDKYWAMQTFGSPLPSPGKPLPAVLGWSSATAAAGAVLCGLPGALLLGVRLFPWEVGTPWIQLVSALPATLPFTAAALGLALLAVWTGTRRHHRAGGQLVLALLLAALLMAQSALVLPRAIPAARAARPVQIAGPGPGPGLRVMTLNVGESGVDAARLLAEARNREIDILALPELAPQGLEALVEAGVADLFPYRSVDVDWVGVGSGLFSKYAMEPRRRVPGTEFHQSRAVASIPGTDAPVKLTAVHVQSPRPGLIWNWRQELRQLGTLPAQGPAGTTVLLGDFNSSAEHREFRALLAGGLTDAAHAVGKGLAPTWPVNSEVPPFVAVDHILVSAGVKVTDVESFILPGTDHAGLVADLVLPAP